MTVHRQYGVDIHLHLLCVKLSLACLLEGKRVSRARNARLQFTMLLAVSAWRPLATF